MTDGKDAQNRRALNPTQQMRHISWSINLREEIRGPETGPSDTKLWPRLRWPTKSGRHGQLTALNHTHAKQSSASVYDAVCRYACRLFLQVCICSCRSGNLPACLSLCQHECVYIYMYLYIYICIYVFMCIYIYTRYIQNVHVCKRVHGAPQESSLWGPGPVLQWQRCA